MKNLMELGSMRESEPLQIILYFNEKICLVLQSSDLQQIYYVYMSDDYDISH